MNKLGIVFGAAAVAIVAGCMDPNYVPPSKRGAQNDATPVGGEAAKPVLSPDVRPVGEGEKQGASVSGQEGPAIDIGVQEAPRCECLPGTIHDAPCACGAPDCKCTVAPAAPAAAKPVAETPAPAVGENTTTYVVRPGDTLFLISKRFNVKLDSIRKANPQLKGDGIRVGQKLTLPAKVELGKYAAAPEPVAPAAKKEFTPYTGATTEYVVKSGDCVSRLAAKSGVTSKQLMTLNNLKDANIRIGQKILLPVKAGGASAAPAAPAPAVKKAEQKPAVAPAAKAEPVVEQPAVAEPAVVEPAQPAAAAPAADAAAATATAAPAADAGGDYIPYVVLKGEDITALSISFGIDPSVIRELNNMSDTDQLVPGQTIRLPADAQ